MFTYRSELNGLLKPFHQGKTRDTFCLPHPQGSLGLQEYLLVVATNRVSTHNIVHKSLIPKKGEILTALTIFWMEEVLSRRNIEHHLVAYGSRIYDFLPGERTDYPRDLHHRAIVVKKLLMIPVEFIFRMYLGGSLYHKQYLKGNDPYGLALPPGLPLMKQFDAPIFTPTEKSEHHDPLHAETTRTRFRAAYTLALHVFSLTRGYAWARDIEMVDSKFEIGIDHIGTYCVADEIATPDSSRFTELHTVEEGREPKWLDKQLLRDEAEAVWRGYSHYPLAFPQVLIEEAVRRYEGILESITGHSLATFQETWLDT